MVDPSWNSVRGMLSTSLLWGRFWCSRTIQIWSKVIPYCDNSAEKIDMSNRRHGGSWVEPLPISEKDWAGTWIERPQSISLCNRCVFVGWRHLKHTPSPCIYGMKNLLEQQQTHKTNRRKFYICADGPHTHTHLDIHYWQRDDLFSLYHCWKCMKMHCAEAKSFGKLSLKLRSL